MTILCDLFGCKLQTVIEEGHLMKKIIVITCSRKCGYYRLSGELREPLVDNKWNFDAELYKLYKNLRDLESWNKDVILFTSELGKRNHHFSGEYFPCCLFSEEEDERESSRRREQSGSGNIAWDLLGKFYGDNVS